MANIDLYFKAADNMIMNHPGKYQWWNERLFKRSTRTNEWLEFSCDTNKSELAGVFCDFLGTWFNVTNPETLIALQELEDL